MNKSSEADRYMGPALSRLGFALEHVADPITYGERQAWAVFYRGADCKLQICWSAREGGIDFMLAPLDAPNEFGLVNNSKQWKFMLALSDLDDKLGIPRLGAGTATWWTWRRALFDTHFSAAKDKLLGTR